jgi:hypothetical protein
MTIEKRTRITSTDTVDVARTVDDALALFTPEGERLWIEGWVPRYPAEIGARAHPGHVPHDVVGRGRRRVGACLR